MAREYYAFVVTWDYPQRDGGRDPFTLNFEVEIKRGLNEPWQLNQTVRGTTAYYEFLTPSEYYARVRTIDIYGRYSSWVETAQAIDPTKSEGTVSAQSEPSTVSASGDVT